MTRPTPERDGTLDDAGNPRGRRGRLVVVALALGAGFFLLLVGLGRVQLSEAPALREKHDRQTLRRLPLPAPRGDVLDREGRVLAGTAWRTDAVILAGDVRLGGSPGLEARVDALHREHRRIQALLGRAEAFPTEVVRRQLRLDRMAPVVLAADLRPEEAERLRGALAADDPVRLRARSERTYPHGALAAHVLGRVRRDMRAPAAVPGDPSLGSTRFLDTTGDSGVELGWEERLSGRPGAEVVRVDAGGFPLAVDGTRIEPVPGENVRLSLDLDLQRAVDAAMSATPGGGRGAAVVLHVATGEVLALVSKPDFDLSAVSPGMSLAIKAQIDAAGGWFNRATQGLYPPGSTFKVFTVLAGLRAGTLDPFARTRCEGGLEVAGHRFGCHRPEGHGALPLRTALAQSCNVYAYQAGLAAGADALAGEARRFHMDAPTGIDLPAETRRMLVPDARWKQDAGRGAWTDRDTVNLAIGQGDLRLSPLQAAAAMASLARRETLTVPTVVHAPGRQPTADRPPEPLGLGDRDYGALLDGMRAVVESGIGQRAQVPGIPIAGKTGTAQIETDAGMTNVAWFLAIAPADRPAIAVAVALEAPQVGVEFAGAEFAAPVVHAAVAAYVDKHRLR